MSSWPAFRLPDTRAYLAKLALANQFEIEELRRTPVEVKVRQLWSLMTSADMFGASEEREREVRQVRERRLKLHQALRG